MFGDLIGGKDYTGGQDKDWMLHLEEDITVFGVIFEGWHKTAQKAIRWFRRNEEGAEAFMRKWHDAERCRAAERHVNAAATQPTVDTSTQRG